MDSLAYACLTAPPLELRLPVYNSALYGPGVEGGVVHFITKKAIDHPGPYSAELVPLMTSILSRSKLDKPY